MITLLKFLFILYVVLIPIDCMDTYSFYISFVHITILDILILLMSGIFISALLLRRVRLHKFSFYFSLLMFITSLLSLISFTYIDLISSPYDAKVTMNFIEYSFLIFIATHIIDDISYLQRVMKWLIISVFILSLFSILKSLDLPIPIPGVSRISGFYLGPFYVGTIALTAGMVIQAGLVLACFPFFLTNSLIRSLNIRIIIGSIVLFASVISCTRSLWIAITMQLVLCMFFVYYTSNKNIKKIAAFLIAFTMIVTILWNFSEIKSFIILLREKNYESRLNAFPLAEQMVMEDPSYLFFGASKDKFRYLNEESVVPHNLFLDILVSKGLVTLILIVGVFVVIIINLLAIYRREKLSGSATYKSYPLLFLIVIIGTLIESFATPTTNSKALWTTISIIAGFISVARLDYAKKLYNHAVLSFSAR